MFQFPRWPLTRLCVQRGVSWYHPAGVAPFGDPRVRLLAADRGLSQRCHVLLRLSTPRHPPCALKCLCRGVLASVCSPALGPGERSQMTKAPRRRLRRPPGEGGRSHDWLLLFVICRLSYAVGNVRPRGIPHGSGVETASRCPYQRAGSGGVQGRYVFVRCRGDKEGLNIRSSPQVCCSAVALRYSARDRLLGHGCSVPFLFPQLAGLL